MHSADSGLKLISFGVCDDIRSEEGGKLTFVGYYGRAIRTGTLPALLPKLCFIAQFEPIAEGTKLNLSVINPGGKLLMTVNDLNVPALDQSVLVPAEFRIAQIMFQITPMPLNEEGRYRVDFAFPNSSILHVDFYVAVDPSLIR